MKTKLFYITAIAAAFTFTGCKKDEPQPSTSAGAGGTIYTNGVFITNEGPFGTGTGTVSFYNRGTGGVSTDIFNVKNGYPLGNVVQSMEAYNGKGYIVVNNAGKVEVVATTTFASAGVISGLTNPRYFLGINSSIGYVSQWGSGAAGEVKVVNLSTNAVTATIATGNGSEGMVKVGNYVYVACSGGYVNDSVVTVIDATTNTVVTNIVAGPNPASIKVDASGKIWVLCGGEWNASFTALVKTGRLVRIDAATNTVDFSLPFSSTTSQPAHLVINNTRTKLYYLYSGAVYSQDYAAAALSGSPLVSRSFYSLAVDPNTNTIYASDAVDFVSNGKIIRYNSVGGLMDSIAGGVIPGNFCFN